MLEAIQKEKIDKYYGPVILINANDPNPSIQESSINNAKFSWTPREEIMEIIVMVEKSLANKGSARFPEQFPATQKIIGKPHTWCRWALEVLIAYLNSTTCGSMPTFRADLSSLAWHRLWWSEPRSLFLPYLHVYSSY